MLLNLMLFFKDIKISYSLEHPNNNQISRLHNYPVINNITLFIGLWNY